MKCKGGKVDRNKVERKQCCTVFEMVVDGLRGGTVHYRQ